MGGEETFPFPSPIGRGQRDLAALPPSRSGRGAVPYRERSPPLQLRLGLRPSLRISMKNEHAGGMSIFHAPKGEEELASRNVRKISVRTPSVFCRTSLFQKRSTV